MTTHTFGFTYPPLHVVSCVLSHGAAPSSEGRDTGGGALGSPAHANAVKAATKRARRMAGRDMGRSGLVERNTY